MFTLGDLKAVITDDLARGSGTPLATQIDREMRRAAYDAQARRWPFSVGGALEYSMSANTASVPFSSIISPSTGYLCQIDDIEILTPQPKMLRNDIGLRAKSSRSLQSGMPSRWCVEAASSFDGFALVVDPAPTSAVTLRIIGIITPALPDLDTVPTPWVQMAGSWLRAETKARLATHVLVDADLALAMRGVAQQELDELDRRARRGFWDGSLDAA